MRAGVWTAPGQIACLDWPEPEPADDEVVVAVAYCGFCGTDASIIDGRFTSGAPPRVLGHEVSGVVTSAGRAVTGIKPGDRVACNIFGYCGTCSWCQAGQPNHCARKFLSAQGFSEFAAYRSDQVYRLPDSLALAHGALLEPVANCVHAVDLGHIRPGETVVVFGGGTIGLLTSQVVRLAGAGMIALVEPDATKRDTALRLGVDLVWDPRTQDVAALARGIGARGGFDVAFEAAGAAQALMTGIDALTEGGRMVVMSIFAPNETVTVRPFLLYQKEISLTGALATAYTFPRALQILPRLRLDELITHTARLEEIAEVYRRHGEPGHIKTLVHP